MFYVEKDILVEVELLMYQAWIVTSSGSCTYCIQYTPMKGNLVNLQSIQNQRNNGSDCGLALNQWQAIIWTNNVPWRTIWRLIESSLSRLFMMLRSLSCLFKHNGVVWLGSFNHGHWLGRWFRPNDLFCISLVYFSVVVCLRVLHQDSVISRPDPCVASLTQKQRAPTLPPSPLMGIQENRRGWSELWPSSDPPLVLPRLVGTDACTCFRYADEILVGWVW